MARQVIYVLSHGTKWKVQCDHCTLEEIKDTQADAIKAAKSMLEDYQPARFQRFAFKAETENGARNGHTVRIPFRRQAKA